MAVEDPTLGLTPEEQAVADRVTGKEVEDDSPVELPSDKPKENDDGDSRLAGKYDSVEDLRSGINELGSDLPDYVLEGMSEEALVRHYKELESNFHEEKSGRKHSKDNEEEDGEKPKDGEDEKPEGVSEELWTDLSTYFEEHGGITDAHYDQLNKAGIPDQVINDYIDGIQMKQQAFTQEIYDIAGGQETYETIKAWAEDYYPAERIEAISRMDKDGMIMAMKGIKADYMEQNPSDGVRITGETRGTGVGSYASQEDYIIDVADKRYGIDKRYTKAVNDKFKNSKNLQ